jgi:hypothetical protein
MEALSNQFVIKTINQDAQLCSYKEVSLNNESVDILLNIVGPKIILSKCINKTTTNKYEWIMLDFVLKELIKRGEIFGYEEVEVFKRSTLYTENDCLGINSDCNLVRLGFKENTVSTTFKNLMNGIGEMKKISKTFGGGSKKSRKYKRKSKKVYKSRSRR